MGRMDEGRGEERGRWWRWRSRCRQEVPGAQSDKRRGANPFKAASKYATPRNRRTTNQFFREDLGKRQKRQKMQKMQKDAKDARGDYFGLFCR
jgi:hypothetical protein